MGLFSKAQAAQINKVAEQSKQLVAPPKTVKKSINDDLRAISDSVVEYFKGSNAELITTESSLHNYITDCINSGVFGIDTETTGLDRWRDHIVGSSLYHPKGVEVYIPCKHIVPIFDVPYKNQLSYEVMHEEFSRLAAAGLKGLYANADFDLAMIRHDFKVNMCPSFYYDVILAWRCLKENELHNDLKSLYNKYVLKGKGDPKRFSDFFPVDLFPYCDPNVAKLYAANDAKITYELFEWQLPYVTKGHPKCEKAKLGQIADLVWNVEMPLVPVCHEMHRTGMYLDNFTADTLKKRYHEQYDSELAELQQMVQTVIDSRGGRSISSRPPFLTGKDFNPNSPTHVQYLIYDLLNLPKTGKGGTGKDILAEFNNPITKQILKVRSSAVLINTFVDKMPSVIWPDQRIHGQFKQIGAGTGRMSSAEPNMQNIPSHATDIRHMFRATPRGRDKINCTETENSIQVNLPRYYFVETPDGDVEVCKLEPGVAVKLENDGIVNLLKLIDIQEYQDDISMMTLTFEGVPVE